jgi:hypothetical protein
MSKFISDASPIFSQTFQYNHIPGSLTILCTNPRQLFEPYYFLHNRFPASVPTITYVYVTAPSELMPDPPIKLATAALELRTSSLLMEESDSRFHTVVT